jgi:hypothetical protein
MKLYVSSLVMMWSAGACGGREVVTPAEPKATVMCAGCTEGPLYAVGAKLQVGTTWVGMCKDGRWHIGVEGGTPPEPCDEQHYTLELSCSASGCDADSSTGSVTLTRPGRYTIAVKFKRAGESDRTVKVAVEADAPARAALTTCTQAANPDRAVVGVNLLNAAGQRLAAPLPDVTAGGTACTLEAYDFDSTQFACPTPADGRLRLALRSGAFAVNEAIACRPAPATAP